MHLCWDHEFCADISLPPRRLRRRFAGKGDCPAELRGNDLALASTSAGRGVIGAQALSAFGGALSGDVIDIAGSLAAGNNAFVAGYEGDFIGSLVFDGTIGFATGGATLWLRGANSIGKLSKFDIERIRTLRLENNVRSRSTIAFLEGNVDGINLDRAFSASGGNTAGLKLVDDQVLFPASRVDGNLRDRDAEFFLLNNIAVTHNLTRNSVGRINLISERTVCPSCTGVTSLFREAFPNIDFNIRQGSNNGLK